VTGNLGTEEKTSRTRDIHSKAFTPGREPGVLCRFLIESMIRWVSEPVGLLNDPARRAWVYFFSPSSAPWNACPLEFPPLGGTPCGGFHRASLFLRGQRKEITKNPLCELCVSSEAPVITGTSGRLIFKDFKKRWLRRTCNLQSILCTHQ